MDKPTTRKMTNQQILKAYNQGAKIADIMKWTGRSYEDIFLTLQTGTKLVTGGHTRPARRRVA